MAAVWFIATHVQLCWTIHEGVSIAYYPAREIRPYDRNGTTGGLNGGYTPRTRSWAEYTDTTYLDSAGIVGELCDWIYYVLSLTLVVLAEKFVDAMRGQWSQQAIFPGTTILCLLLHQQVSF